MLRISIFFLFILHFSAFAELTGEGEIIVDGVTVESMQQAEKLITDGSVIYLGPGIYSEGIHIRKNNVTLSGSEGSHFVDAAIEGKAAIITSGDNTVIENIECSGIKVSSGNGSCIRHQGKNLTVQFSYFHDSQQGILEAGNDGALNIKHSRFERLGYNGRAHGVYTNGAELTIENSTFISMVNQGHAIKSRSRVTTIKNTLISTEDGKDSRLIDISDGGVLNLSNSILMQTDKTVNRQIIGFGLEKMKANRIHAINIHDNLIIGERERGNEFLLLPGVKKWQAGVKLESAVYRNVLLGKYYDIDKWSAGNTVYRNRAEAGLAVGHLPSVNNLSLTLAVLEDPKLSSAKLETFKSVYRSDKAANQESEVLFERANWPAVGPNKESLKASRTATEKISVNSVSSLVKALKNAKPGQMILIEDGEYLITQKKINVSSRRPEKDTPIQLTARNPGKVTLKLDSLEGIYLSQPYWIISGLRFQGICKDHSKCEHAIHVVGNAENIQIIHNEFLDFNAAIKVNRVKNAYPDKGAIKYNHFYSTVPRNTNRSVTPVNIDHASGWVVSKNIIQDFIKTRGNKVSYGAFIKGGAQGGEISNNLVVCNTSREMPYGSELVGLSIGGGGMKDRRNGVDYEASGIRVANNIVFNCNDVGVYVNRGKSGLIENNTLINTSGIDVRYPESDMSITNNLYSGKISRRDQAIISTSNGNTKLSGVIKTGKSLKTLLNDDSFRSLIEDKNGELRNSASIVTSGRNYDFCDVKVTSSYVGAAADYVPCFTSQP